MYKPEDLWAFSGLASRKIGSTMYNYHMVGIVQASNKFEAIGKANLIVNKAYPISDLWGNHTVSVQRCDKVLDAERLEDIVVL